MRMNREKREKFSEINSKVKEVLVTNKCFLCGKQMSSPCNSHVVPRFVLKSLAEHGMLFYGQTLMRNNDFIKCEKGINNAFTFHLICSKCDNSYFSGYETPAFISEFDSYDWQKKQRLCCEIAVKSLLANISVKRYQSTFVKTCYGFGGIGFDLDLVDCQKKLVEVKKCKNSKEKKINIIYSRLLDYETKLACQCVLAIVKDLEGNVCFDMHDFVSTSVSNYLYLSIFPYEGKTRLLLFNFIHEKEDNNTKLINQFYNLCEEDKLKFIFVALTMHSEQFFISPSLNEIIKKDKKLVRMYSETDNNFLSDKPFDEFRSFRQYTNYLSEKYKKIYEREQDN